MCTEFVGELIDKQIYLLNVLLYINRRIVNTMITTLHQIIPDAYCICMLVII